MRFEFGVLRLVLAVVSCMFGTVCLSMEACVEQRCVLKFLVKGGAMPM